MKKEQKNRVLSARSVLAELLTICATALFAQNVTGSSSAIASRLRVYIAIQLVPSDCSDVSASR